MSTVGCPIERVAGLRLVRRVRYWEFEGANGARGRLAASAGAWRVIGASDPEGVLASSGIEGASFSTVAEARRALETVLGHSVRLRGADIARSPALYALVDYDGVSVRRDRDRPDRWRISMLGHYLTNAPDRVYYPTRIPDDECTLLIDRRFPTRRAACEALAERLMSAEREDESRQARARRHRPRFRLPRVRGR